MVVEHKNRKFTRIHIDHKVTLDFISESYEDCGIKDLNLTGMFVYGSFQYQEGEECNTKITLTGLTTGLTLLASAKIVRKCSEGIAIEFTAMSIESYMFLQTVLLYEAGEPLFIGLELPEHCPFEITDQCSSFDQQMM